MQKFESQLFDACRRGELELVQALAESGNEFQFWGLVAAQQAASHGQLDVLKFIASKVDLAPQIGASQILVWAVENGHVDVAKFLVSLRHITLTTDEQTSFLCWAASEGQLEMVRYLIDELAIDPHLRDDLAFRWAASKGHLEVTKYLAETHGVKITTKEQKLLLCSVATARPELAEYLLNFFRNRFSKTTKTPGIVTA